MNTRKKGVLLFARTLRRRTPMLCIKPSIVTVRHVTANEMKGLGRNQRQ